MIEEVLPNLYKMEIPLPNNPLKALNSYVIKSQERNLIIDTGMNREECLKVMLAGLKHLNINLNDTDFFITHFHADHLGNVLNLATPSSKIYFNQPDADLMNSDRSNERGITTDEYLNRNGFPEDQLRDANDKHPGRKYSPQGKINYNVLEENFALRAGDYLFKTVVTPGHSKGHMCLYETDKKILVSGDHILKDITPNISLFSDDNDPLEEYINSLEKISELEIDVVLPGHRRIFYDCRARIEDLKYHHQQRAEEVLNILNGSKQNAFRIAAQMTWDLDCDSWDDFPSPQKWFAIGEALAHIKYLENKGALQRETGKQEITFSLT